MNKITQAVALEYGMNKTPVLRAKGSDDLADAIVAEARRQGIYIAQDARLAGLLGELKLDQEIPENLYVAVAVILSWIYWLKGMVPGDEKKPPAAD